MAKIRVFVLGLLLGVPLAAAEKPSLVVVISVDQMRADYLERFRPWFGPDGFNRFLEKGAVFPQARHRHSTTFTGPGHASIGTGLDPRDHGIVGNIWYDVRRRESVYWVEDPRADGMGAPPDPPAAPAFCPPLPSSSTATRSGTV